MSSAKSARYDRFSGGPANLPSSDSSGVRGACRPGWKQPLGLPFRPSLPSPKQLMGLAHTNSIAGHLPPLAPLPIRHGMRRTACPPSTLLAALTQPSLSVPYTPSPACPCAPRSRCLRRRRSRSRWYLPSSPR
uniref:TNF receptor-associated factor 7 n=1 Tax=Mus musculus TaxID=10090 RepID=H3BLM6_MOUSE